MRARLFQMTWPGLLAVAVMPAPFGGWVVITVDDPPDYAVAGQPFTLTYRVRQHGVELLDGLKGRIEATTGRETARVDARQGKERGQYLATVTLPSAGDWSLTIHSGFPGKSSVKLLPLSAISAGGMLPKPLDNAERGKRLFAAKGCVACHVHTQVKSEHVIEGAGPELTFKRFDADYLKRYLADPSIIGNRRSSDMQMPNLGLKPGEIEALVAFVNGRG